VRRWDLQVLRWALLQRDLPGGLWGCFLCHVVLLPVVVVEQLAHAWLHGLELGQRGVGRLQEVVLVEHCWRVQQAKPMVLLLLLPPSLQGLSQLDLALGCHYLKVDACLHLEGSAQR